MPATLAWHGWGQKTKNKDPVTEILEKWEGRWHQEAGRKNSERFVGFLLPLACFTGPQDQIHWRFVLQHQRAPAFLIESVHLPQRASLQEKFVFAVQ